MDGRPQGKSGNLVKQAKVELPALPKLEKGQRAILVVQGDTGKPEWIIRQPGPSRGESAGTSLTMIAVALVVYNRFMAWWNSD